MGFVRVHVESFLHSVASLFCNYIVAISELEGSTVKTCSEDAAGECDCCKPGPLPMGRSLIPRACRQDILHRSYLMG